MIGRVEETSASFEARSAPRSYPTTVGSFATEAVEATLRRMSASPRKRPSAIEMQFVAECQ